MPALKQIPLWADHPRSGVAERALRPIHYLGSKLRLLDPIRQTLDDLNPAGGRVIDLFAGSGTVSAALAASRPVTAVDIQEFSRVLCSTLLRPHPMTQTEVEALEQRIRDLEKNRSLSWALQPLLSLESQCLLEAAAGHHEGLTDLLEFGAIERSETRRGRNQVHCAHAETTKRLHLTGLAMGADSVMSRYYGGVYFSFRQALEFDAILNSAEEAPAECRDVILASVASTASEVVNTVGKQFAQPIRLRTRDGLTKSHLVGKVLRDRSLSVTNIFRRWLDFYLSLEQSAFEHQAVRSDYADFLHGCNQSVGVIYADPPYTRDHYSRFYHVLETICLRDEPEISKSNLGEGTMASRGMYRAVRHQSPFCVKSQAPGAFDLLFSRARRLSVPLAVSYSPFDIASGAHPRVMSIERIVELARRHYATVDVVSVGPFTHSKFNSASLALGASGEAEVIIRCIP